jgi:hypothetical protein
VSVAPSHQWIRVKGSRCGSALKWRKWENEWNWEDPGSLPTLGNLIKKTNSWHSGHCVRPQYTLSQVRIHVFIHCCTVAKTYRILSLCVNNKK